jgi:hypothetical protein
MISPNCRCVNPSMTRHSRIRAATRSSIAAVDTLFDFIIYMPLRIDRAARPAI